MSTNHQRSGTTQYAMSKEKALQLFAAGLVAATSMTLLAYLFRAVGIFAPEYAAQYGAILNGQVYPAAWTSTWWAGLGWHAFNGAVLFPLLYDYLAHRTVLPSRRNQKGLLFGAALWMLAALVVAPLAGEGVFFRNTAHPVSFLLTSLVTWLTYGFVLERAMRARIVHNVMHTEQRRAVQTP